MDDLLKLCFFVAILVNCEYYSDAQMLGKETYASVPQLINKAGYPVEKHRVKTPDGYILQLHRIPAGRRSARSGAPSAKGKKAVLLVHGLVGSSGDFIIMGPERSLGYKLADAGYDVWLGNLRGNIYTSHETLKKSDPEFWEYSFTEHGKYDVTSMIDKILNVTGLPKLMYIGYSMGCTSFFTMMSQRPEYNDKVFSFIGLAPAVYLDTIKPLCETLLVNLNLPATLRAQGMMSLNPQPEMMDLLIGSVCNVKQQQLDLCMRMVYMIVGEDYEQNDWNMSSVIMARFQPASWRQLEHFGKIALTGVFTSWEDGLNGPIKPFNLTNVRVPVSLLYGENDLLTHKSQVLRLADEMKSLGVLEAVRPGCSWPKFNHLDFVFAKDIGKLLNKPLVKHVNALFEKYYPKDA